MSGSVVSKDDPELLRRNEEVAQREGLGAIRSAYLPGPHPGSSKWGWIVTGGLVLAAVIAGITNAHSGTRYWSGFFGMFAVLFLIVTLGSYARERKYNRKLVGARLELREHGLVIGFRDRAIGLRYDTVDVQQNLLRHNNDGVETWTTLSYTFNLPGREMPVVIDQTSFPGATQWGTEIQQAIVSAQAPTVLARLQAGEKVEFAPFWITATEVGIAQDEIGNTPNAKPWSEIRDMDVDRAHVQIRYNGGLLNPHPRFMYSTPNFSVFRALFEHLRQAHNPTAAG